jgi:hypothetical protein
MKTIHILLGLLLFTVEPRIANAQPGTRNPEPGTAGVEVEPVTCWWRTSATAIRVGEPFSVVLTCSLLQTEAARVVADESRLDASVVQVPPFEVVGGFRAKDVATASRRFIQFEYRLRVIAENVFASEVALPPLEIGYRVESQVMGGESLVGRDLTYALPSLTMRVLSLVPDTAGDIREAGVASFADVEGLGSRATMLRAAAGVIIGLGVLMLVLALLTAVRRRRAARPSSERVLSGAVVLSGVRRELAVIKDQVRGSGWTADLAGRAVAALRVVTAYATGRLVTQRSVSVASQGELLVSGRFGAPAVVSSTIATTDDEELRDAFARFNAARYGREPGFDALDDALEAAMRRADRVAAGRPLLERLWAR